MTRDTARPMASFGMSDRTSVTFADDLHWLHGASRRPRYLGHGAAWPLYAHINDLQGNRGRIERLALTTIGRRGSRKPVTAEVHEAWERLRSGYPDHITAALFVYTGYFKDTVLSGVVQGQESLFIKVFSSRDGHRDEADRIGRLQTVVPDSITLAPLVHAADGIVAYRLLTRAAQPASARLLHKSARDIGVQALGLSAAWAPDGSTAVAHIAHATSELLSDFGLQENRLAILSQGERVPQPIAHGDFTPWNAFSTPTGRLALVDYERVAHRAPFTDVWHHYTQPRALARRVELPEHLLSSVAEITRTSRASVRTWYATYLAEELQIDLTDWVVRERRHPQLRDLIETKAAMLARTLKTVELA